MSDAALVREALELARRGIGAVEPNPRVGALALDAAGRTVGRGWHRRYGGAHAEVNALQDAQAQGASVAKVVVTLEPCSSERGRGGKKTPPCTEALLAAGVQEVVIGMEDPDPRHRGHGCEALRAAGVRVVSGVESEACAAVNRPFFRWLGLERPWTIAKYAMSLDGKTATHTGDSRWISGDSSLQRAHELRAAVDGVVVGYRTARIDAPRLTVRLVEGRHPLRIVIDPALELVQESAERPLFRDQDQTPSLVLHGPEAPDSARRLLEDLGVQLLSLPGTARRLDLVAGWKALRARGLRRLLVEGGGGLLAELVSADCLDQVVAVVAPCLIGGQQAPTPLGGGGFERMAEVPRLQESYSERLGDDLLLGGFLLPD